MMGSISIGLACRDELGNLDKLSMVSFTGDADVLTVGCDPEDGVPFEIALARSFLNHVGSGYIVIDSDNSFDFSCHRAHVGNICWDRVSMSCDETAELATYLSRSGFWQWEMICDDLKGPWERKQFCGADFLKWPFPF